MPAIVCCAPKALPFSEDFGFEDPFYEDGWNWDVVLTVALVVAFL